MTQMQNSKMPQRLKLLEVLLASIVGKEKSLRLMLDGGKG